MAPWVAWLAANSARVGMAAKPRRVGVTASRRGTSALACVSQDGTAGAAANDWALPPRLAPQLAILIPPPNRGVFTAQ